MILRTLGVQVSPEPYTICSTRPHLQLGGSTLQIVAIQGASRTIAHRCFLFRLHEHRAFEEVGYFKCILAEGPERAVEIYSACYSLPLQETTTFKRLPKPSIHLNPSIVNERLVGSEVLIAALKLMASLPSRQ